MVDPLCPQYRSMLFQNRVIYQWLEDVGTTGPHVVVIVDASNDHAQLSNIARAIHVQDFLDFLCPRLKTSMCSP